MRFLIATLGLIAGGFWAGVSTAQDCQSEAACLDAYAQAIVERDAPADFVAAGNALRDGCSDSETGLSCRILALMVARGVVPGQAAEVQPLIDHACKRGDDRACNWMAERVLTSDFWSTERAPDYAEKRGWVEDECRTGNDFACRKLVRYIDAEAEARYRDLCDHGGDVFCALLGGVHIYPDYDETAQAEAVFRKWCETGQGMACIFLADVISSGNGSDFNETSAPHMERACDLGIVHGCNVARDHMLAKDPDASAAKRLRYLRPACEGGWVPACLRVAEIERWTNDTTKIQYAMTLRLDCLEGGWRSCEAAAYAFRAVQFQMELHKVYGDVDQFYENYFDLAEALKGR